ncbi:unnamed protein product [Rotaria sordida]|uniref:Methylated-DNA--protein-cysteine methyltransferase n=1 Tax=Rotaria sordida TaxID=392033 RepID=A0A813QM84_9BILA|nr:unnamed protein product [Rotaria sordida]CAF0867021.1 unnamed protein product [Rotaria sordida]CAF0902684.1 unnamed protein product [Rotaria sordida]CAF0943489.1 unnamed protein product [Rotaria sordida]CAF3552635.1 unnamed protein product [Rotaria sordida]
MCETSSSICSSPIGDLIISYCQKGLHSICQISTINDQSFIPDENQTIEIQSSSGKIPIPKSCLNWLHTYFHSPNHLAKIPELCPNIVSKNDSFQENVWRTLLNNVHFGQTVTYGQLAELAGNKNAARAVGTAMRCNPFQLLVPCHRVIRSNGDIGNYSGGKRNNVKYWLLNHEQK